MSASRIEQIVKIAETFIGSDPFSVERARNDPAYRSKWVFALCCFMALERKTAMKTDTGLRSRKRDFDKLMMYMADSIAKGAAHEVSYHNRRSVSFEEARQAAWEGIMESFISVGQQLLSGELIEEQQGKGIDLIKDCISPRGARSELEGIIFKTTGSKDEPGKAKHAAEKAARELHTGVALRDRDVRSKGEESTKLCKDKKCKGCQNKKCTKKNCAGCKNKKCKECHKDKTPRPKVSSTTADNGGDIDVSSLSDQYQTLSAEDTIIEMIDRKKAISKL